jgi:membrane-associated protein
MDIESLVESVGYIGIFLAVFIECGVPLGIVLPLPGFTLLFSAGVFAATGTLSLPLVFAVGLSAAVLGYVVGYLTGYRYGRKLFYELKTKRFFTPEQGRRTEKFMKRFGYSTLVIGRFLAVVHNIAPILGGIAKMKFLPFMLANMIGALLWVGSAVFGGYYLGQSVPHGELYVIPLFIAALLLVNTPQGRRQMSRISEKVENL